MSTKQRSLLTNLNRLVILALTEMGLLMDGCQLADVPVTIALLAWLWLSAFTRGEARFLGWLEGRARGAERESDQGKARPAE